MKTKCQCKLCSVYLPLSEKIRSALSPKLRGSFDLIVDDWRNNAQDANYYRCILNGTWPTAEQHLLEGLRKARERIKQEEAGK